MMTTNFQLERLPKKSVNELKMIKVLVGMIKTFALKAMRVLWDCIYISKLTLDPNVDPN